jgi:SAM-dependent methyltransferase
MAINQPIGLTLVRDNERGMNASAWNHNIHYHDLVLRSVPPGCRRALDVGCGQLLARHLATHCQEVIGIDVDPDTLSCARSVSGAETRITFIDGDVMTHAFDDSFDLVTAVAVLHHLPLRPALARFQNLLRSGGILSIIRLYRGSAPSDYALAAVAVPANWALRCRYCYTEVGAPVQDPRETLHEIRTACDVMLPGAVIRRRLLFRYSLNWCKP